MLLKVHWAKVSSNDHSWKKKIAGRPRALTTIVPVQDVIDVAEEFLLIDLLPQLGKVDGTLTLLARRGLLANSFWCVPCGVPCGKVIQEGIDRYVWRCSRCRRKKSLHHGSFFSGSHISLEKLVVFFYMWAEDMPLTFIKRQTALGDDGTARNWANMVRELCSQNLLANFRQLGGLDINGIPIIVEIDESEYFHRKYHSGAYREGHWVFRAVERETGRCLLEVVPNRSRRTLEAIISQLLLCWKWSPTDPAAHWRPSYRDGCSQAPLSSVMGGGRMRTSTASMEASTCMRL